MQQPNDIAMHTAAEPMTMASTTPVDMLASLADGPGPLGTTSGSFGVVTDRYVFSVVVGAAPMPVLFQAAG